MSVHWFRICAAAALFVALTPQPARAALVTFETLGVFSSTGTDSLAKGGITITFTGVTTTVDATSPGEFTSFGSFDVTGDNPSTGGLDGETFLLTISQLLPAGSTDFSATLAGQINKNNSTATLEFVTPLSKEILGFWYTVVNGELDLPAPGGSLDLAGHVIVSEDGSNGNPIPEPASLLLFGMAAVATAQRLRRRPTR